VSDIRQRVGIPLRDMDRAVLPKPPGAQLMLF
jgi:hypothetical protein